MNPLRTKTLLTLAASLLITLASHASASWGTDLDAALAEAKTSGRHVLVNFTGSDWCGFCIKLHDEVLSGEAFQAWAGANLVLVELDFPRKKEQSAEMKARNKALKEKFEVPGFPTVVLMDGDGKVLLTEVGYGPGTGDEWLAKFKAAAGGSN